LVMESGRIIEQGSHSDLLALEGRYSQLYRQQFNESEAI
jgi:ABC-type multidrug transport system fused ATPase/permease subunit